MTNTDTTPMVRVMRAAGTDAIAAGVQQAATFAAVGQCVVVASLVFRGKYPTHAEQRWQFSLSHVGQPPVLVSEHRHKHDAENQARRVVAVAMLRDLCDAATFRAFLAELAATSE